MNDFCFTFDHLGYIGAIIVMIFIGINIFLKNTTAGVTGGLMIGAPTGACLPETHPGQSGQFGLNPKKSQT